MSDALVSVIIPAYNAAEFIGETLDSVFAQTFTRYEVIVINDGSPDTEALEQVLARYPSNLHYIKQENQGAAAARNTGLRASQAEFVAFLDADDTWLPEFLEKQMDFLERSNADLVYSDAHLVDESTPLNRTFMQLHPSQGEVTPESLLALKTTVLTSTVVARKAPILAVGLFDESVRRGHDFELWLRLAKAGFRFGYQCVALACHRILESSLSGDLVSQFRRTIAVLEVVKARGSLTAREDAALQFNMNRTRQGLALENGKEKLLGRDFAGALRSFNEARQFSFSWKLVFVCFALKVAPDMFWRLYTRREAADG